MIALSGVRSSWLILARKSDFARFADSALLSALRSRSSALWRWVTSTTVPSVTRSPFQFTMRAVRWIQTGLPSRLIPSNS